MQVGLQGLAVFGIGIGRCLGDDALDARGQLVGDGHGDLVLQREQILVGALIGFAPDVEAVARVDQLRRHAHATAGLAQGAFEQPAHTQLAGEHARVPARSAQGERGGARSDLEAFVPRQAIEQFLGNAIGEEALVALRAQIRERQYADGVDRRVTGRSGLGRAVGRLLEPGRRIHAIQPPGGATDREQHHGHGERGAGTPGDAALAGHAARGHIEEPRNNQRHRETENHAEHGPGQSPGRQAQRFKGDLGRLQHDPADHRIGDAGTHHAAPLQFLPGFAQ